MATAPEDGIDETAAEPAEEGEVRLAQTEADLSAVGRLVALSDGVVAIAITLLALELPVPRAGSATAMLHDMGHHLTAYYAFFISFAVIAAHWTDHHMVFRWDRRLGGHVQSLNMLWLMFLVLTPYLTRLLAEGGGAGFVLRFELYALAQAIVGVLFAAMIREMRRNDLFRRGTPQDTMRAEQRDFVVMASIFVISIPLALVAGQWTYLVWLAIPLTFRIWGGRKPQGHPGHMA